jgi:hypothetical protein
MNLNPNTNMNTITTDNDIPNTSYA